MRIISSTALLLVVCAIVANAEPPPLQAVAAAPAVTVSDQQANALPAVMVTQVDTAKSASSTAETTRVDTAAQATRDGGHGLGFWAVIAVIMLALIYGVYRFVTRQPEPKTVATSRSEADEVDRTRTKPPGSSGRRND